MQVSVTTGPGQDVLSAALAENARALELEHREIIDEQAFRWLTYARSLLGSELSTDEREALPDILIDLNISPADVEADRQRLERIHKYEAILADVPLKTLVELRAEAKVAYEAAEQARRAVSKAQAYEGRKLDITMRLNGIRAERPELMKAVGELSIDTSRRRAPRSG